MKFSDLFRFSTDNLRRRKGRTILTVIGVVVGVCAIVVMISLGIAVNRATEALLQSYGDLTKITVYRWGAQQGTPDLDDTMVEQFKGIPGVVAATPMYRPESFYGQVYAGKGDRYENWGPGPVAMDAISLPNMGYNLVTGSFDIGQNLGRNKIPVLVESSAIFNFADTKKNYNNPNFMIYPEYDETYTNITNKPQYDELGNLLNPDDSFFDMMRTSFNWKIEYGYDSNTGDAKYMEYELVVVGIFDAANDWNVNGAIVMSTENMERVESEYKRKSGSGGSSSGGGMGYMYFGGSNDTVDVGGYESVYIKVDDVNNMPDIEEYIRDLGYQIESMSDMRRQLQGQVSQTQMMLGGLAAISLFVAALNIANTMTMAIYERTKEIGVMKVLGCKLPNIRQMFLIESGAIGFIGGLVGVVLSIILGMLLNYLPMLLMMLGIESDLDIAGLFGLSGLSEMMPGMQVSVIPLWLIVLALAFATGVGILSGIAPANRAVKISSLEAIRHE